MDFLKPEEARALARETARRYERFVNRGLCSLLKFMVGEVLEWRAEGCFVYDAEGRRFIDCLGGFGVFSLGHRHPKVVEAVRRQLERMPLSSRALFSPLLGELAERLARVAPGRLEKTFMCNSGAEAVEGALKLARLATGRTKIVSAEGAFHGKTMGALSASGREVYKKPFEPLLPGFCHVPFGDKDALAEAVDSATAAVILEPIQGEGGVIIPPEDYLPAARELTEREGALLILDEVQTGLGRTGRMFACEHWGVEPDVMCLAKALGGGVVPAGCFIAREELWGKFEESPLLHSSTFGGSPMACAAAIAVLDVLEEERLWENAERVGRRLLEGLKRAAREVPGLVREVRGKGLLIGVEFEDADLAGLVVAGLIQRGVLCAYTLNNPKVVRVEPPLIMTEELADEVVSRFGEALEGAARLAAEAAG
ncbi:MAG TPA: aminotransferase class III-fold pyridoxal phosphate-dependent enzyme [Armatimonadetes bacterium]|nr:aminotransferase class III-fold pyridoxal phosphate-dependent enzyme [Armatimonadota bacterium]